MFKNMEIKNPEENAIKFYANMFIYYSMYDGAADKEMVKVEFVSAIKSLVQDLKRRRIRS